MKHLASALILSVVGALPGCSSAEAPVGPPLLAVERTIPLSNVSGRIDHLAVDLRHRRIFVAELGNGMVEAIDLDSGRSRRIQDLKEPQGLAFLADRGELVVASGGDGSVRFYDADSLALRATVSLGGDADNARVDPVSGMVAIGYGSGAIAFIDPVRHAVVRTIVLPAHPEGFQLDPQAGRVFVNLPDAHAIAFADRTTGSIAKRLPGSHALNFPLAFDAPSRTVAVVYRWPARLALLDSETGGVRQDMATCGDSDDLFFDSQRRRLYVVCGSGAVDVFERRGEGYEHVSRVATREGARTGLFVPELDRLIVAARAQGKAGAALLILRPT
ncbi:MAG TPA: hypothetical protein VF499_09125 [Afipia sp.]